MGFLIPRLDSESWFTQGFLEALIQTCSPPLIRILMLLLRIAILECGGKNCRNVVAFSDGIPGKSAGIPYFYLTTLDPTAANALKDQRSSFTISEYPIGTCGETDPENPTCAKVTLTGKLKLVDADSEEAGFAVENGKAQAANFPSCTIEPNIGTVAVLDPRLHVLSDLSKSQKMDIAGGVKGASYGEVLLQGRGPLPKRSG
ncbi:uncharacterized protein [Spinacia oleracea]|uniref:Uncharacterized protein isoform X2 n=1 Tax=Spinacia oleracea TaxID=3562 RepID=A0ABM3QZX3_SPIOL|nr:uncharacterized protein LOC110784727 isoform X2 [Spinacia oleracea]